MTTDNEIIKALEVCVGIHNDCEECPLLGYSLASDECMTEAMSNALDLINRQKAAIEALKLINSTYKAEVSEIRKIANQELAYKLQERCNNQEGCVYASDIGAVLNEMIDDTETFSEDFVSRAVFDQFKWERDIAFKTLKEHGLSLGEIKEE